MRKLMWFTIGFSGACLLCSCFFGSWGILAAAVSFLIFAIFTAAAHRVDKKALKISAAVFLGISAGIFWFNGFKNTVFAVPQKYDGQVVHAAITVSDYSQKTDYGIRADGNIQLDGRNLKICFYLNENSNLTPGDRISGYFNLRSALKDGSKESSYYSGNGVYLLGYAKGKISIDKAEQVPFKFKPAVWRHTISQKIDQIFSPATAGFARALLLGDRSGMDYKVKTDLKISGISHIVAVSGLHVSILLSFICLFTAKKRFLTGIIGIPALIVFAAVAGFTPSVTRACIMQCLVLLALMLNREYDPPTALSFAVLSMLLWNPLTILSVSFQLSVSCIAGIFLFYHPVYNWFANHFGPVKGNGLSARIKRWLFASISVTVSTNLMTTPLVAHYFGTVSIVGVLTNLLTLWAVSLAFYGILVSLIVSLISFKLAAVIAFVPRILIRYIVAVASLLARLPLSAVYTVSIYTVAWLIGAYVMLAVFLLIKKKHPGILICSLIFTLLISQSLAWLEPIGDECRVTALDVGQGQCILLQSEGKAILVDCGGDSPQKAADAAAEALLSQGISHLDGLIVSHYDMDHVGGVIPLMSRMDIDLLLLPDIRDEKGMSKEIAAQAMGDVRYVSDTTKFQFGDTRLTIAGPVAYNMDNESSLCVLFQTKNCDILITGDRGTYGEQMLMQEITLPDLEVLVAGHHGSATSTSRELLSATAPDVVMISAGHNNRFGHPSQEVLKRLSDFGCKVYRTDRHGSVTFRR